MWTDRFDATSSWSCQRRASISVSPLVHLPMIAVSAGDDIIWQAFGDRRCCPVAVWRYTNESPSLTADRSRVAGDHLDTSCRSPRHLRQFSNPICRWKRESSRFSSWANTKKVAVAAQAVTNNRGVVGAWCQRDITAISDVAWNLDTFSLTKLSTVFVAILHTRIWPVRWKAGPQPCLRLYGTDNGRRVL